MSAYSDPPLKDATERADSVTWIGRDRPAPSLAAPAEDLPESPPPGGLTAAVRNKPSRWIIGGSVLLAVVVALLVARHYMKPAAPGVAAGPESQLPLVSVSAPGTQAVQSTVSFTGTIHARYDMPISPEGESGRITAVLVEPGDRVKQGQVLARIDQSVLRPQLHRLEASLEEAKAQAALSAAEYRRAQAVEAAGALSAEEIARRRATLGDR